MLRSVPLREAAGGYARQDLAGVGSILILQAVHKLWRRNEKTNVDSRSSHADVDASQGAEFTPA
jgi:hypothetical protein